MAEQTFGRIVKADLRPMETVNGAAGMALKAVLSRGRSDAFKGESGAGKRGYNEKKGNN